MAAIDVPQGAPVVYIGDLKLRVVDAAANNIDTSGFQSSTLLTAVQPKASFTYGVQAEVTNGMEAAIQDLNKSYPQKTGIRPVESIMELEKERPNAILNTSLPGVKLISPRPTGGFRSLVKSLQPTLSWESAQTPGVKYDLVIYTGVSVRQGGRVDILPGKEVYYREALDTTSHTLEAKLLRKSQYLWSVRTRVGTNVSRWSKIKREGLLGGVEYYWDFVTPKKELQ